MPRMLPIPLETTKQRQDLVIKTILRTIRKYYLQDFCEKTNFLTKKRRKGPEFLTQTLSFYIDGHLN